MTTRADYANLQKTRTQQLRDRAADRPQHAAYLERLLALADPIEVLEAPTPSGLSERLAESLRIDVDWCREPLPDEVTDALTINQRGAQYPNAYEDRRVADARGAARRRSSQHGPRSLTSLLRFDGE